MPDNIIADCAYGCSETNLRSEFKRLGLTWQPFKEFMHGQTTGFEHEDTVYYISDINRYLEKFSFVRAI